VRRKNNNCVQEYGKSSRFLTKIDQLLWLCKSMISLLKWPLLGIELLQF
jgi:hypothetical protein